MKKPIALLCMAGLCTAAPAFGSGYRIPEQSLNGVALGGACVANTPTADASYQNPANMGWLGEGWQTEDAITYINLPKVKYDDQRSPAYSGDSKVEEFLVPQLHLVSPRYNHLRFGLSVIHPAGLSKRWDEPYPRTFAEDFTLKVLEVNPNVSYTFSDRYAVALGARLLRADGKVVSNGTVAGYPDASALNPALPPVPVTVVLSRDLNGDTIEYGWNLAISAKPTDNLTFALTYRSNIDLGIEGDANLSNRLVNDQYGTLATLGAYSGGANVSVPVPAVLTLAAAYTFGQTTVELVWDKTYWSEYENLDFNYDQPLYDPSLPVAAQPLAALDAPSERSWSNSNAYRLGISHRLNDALTLMAGFAIDQNPVPDHTLGFELPDSDARLYSLGARYQVNDQLTMGLAYLYDDKESRTVNNGMLDGTFSDGGAHMLSLGGRYTF